MKSSIPKAEEDLGKPPRLHDTVVTEFLSLKTPPFPHSLNVCFTERWFGHLVRFDDVAAENYKESVPLQN
jgi:hypothetical protein